MKKKISTVRMRKGMDEIIVNASDIGKYEAAGYAEEGGEAPKKEAPKPKQEAVFMGEPMEAPKAEEPKEEKPAEKQEEKPEADKGKKKK